MLTTAQPPASMDATLEQMIFERLDQAGGPEQTVAAVVRAACRGPEELAAELEGSTGIESPVSSRTSFAAPPAKAFLRSLSVEGFRGIGQRTTLELDPRPGLTLVVGPNGSGKSSLAESLELLLTQGLRRWRGRPVAWQRNWQCLHHGGGATIEAQLELEGEPAARVLRRTWSAGADFDSSGGAEQLREQLEELGWSAALERYRPFMGHSELAATFDAKPSELYKVLSRILGLDDIEEVREAIAVERRRRDRGQKDLRERLGRLIGALEHAGDSRAAAAHAALAAVPPDLDAAAAVLEQASGDEGGRSLAPLRMLAGWEVPGDTRVADAYEALQRAHELNRSVPGDMSRARSVAALLDQALAHHAAHPADLVCPVCSAPGALDDGWAERARDELARLRSTAHDADRAAEALRSARKQLGGLLGNRRAALAAAAEAGLEHGDLDAAWDVWESEPEQRPLFDAARRSLEQLVVAARGELERRDDTWRPLARELAAVIQEARAARSAAAEVKRLKAAEEWVKDVADDLRGERFAPIARQAQEHWERLRQTSSVSLQDMRLARRGSNGQAVFDVKVDGAEANALGVMSQGELMALAVSVFLPRACLPESPFRFLVVDDPVQSMDASKVDGLARAFGAAATGRQVIVFTHDSRLADSARRLGLPTEVVEVARKSGSVVELRPSVAA